MYLVKDKTQMELMLQWISQMLNGEDVYINGETSRDFTYIDNVVQANILAGTTINPQAFAGGRETFFSD